MEAGSEGGHLVLVIETEGRPHQDTEVPIINVLSTQHHASALSHPAMRRTVPATGSRSATGQSEEKPRGRSASRMLQTHIFGHFRPFKHS